MRRFAASSLRARLLPIVAAALLPALGFVLYSGWAEAREVRAQALDTALRIARIFAAEPEGAIDEAHQTLLSLLGGAAATPPCSRFTPALLQQHPSFDQLGVLAPDGGVECNAGPLDGAIDLPGDFPPDRFTVTRLGLGGSPVVAALQPVRDGDGPVRAIGFAALDLPRLGSVAAKLDLPAGSSVALVGERGDPLLLHPPNGSSHARDGGGPIRRLVEAATGDGTRRVRDPDGRWRLYGFTPLHGPDDAALGWIHVGIPEDAILAPVRRATQRNLLGLALATSLAVGVLWASSRAFVLDAVGALVHASRELAAGRLSARSGTRTGAGELRQLARAFDEMAESLERSVLDTRRALDALGESRTRLRGLSHWLIDTQESERRHIARELHDEVGQALTAVTLQLGQLRRHAGERDGGPGGRRIDATMDLVRHALDQVRGLSLELRPAMLDDLGLAPTLRWYCARQAERSGVAITLRAEGLTERPPGGVETACFRIAQEALTNVARHARASRVEVDVRLDAGALHLLVRDDGHGFDVAAERARAQAGGGFGLLGMEERAALLGGDLAIESRPGAGATVRVRLPLDDPASTEAS